MRVSKLLRISVNKLKKEKKVPKTLNVNTRVDPITLAKILTFLETKNVYVRSASSAISESLEALITIIENESPTLPMTINEATAFLTTRNLMQKASKNKTLREALACENINLAENDKSVFEDALKQLKGE